MKNTDFIRRIDAKKALVGLHADLDAEAVQRCIEALGMVKAADVVQVVRCRDCLFWQYERVSCEGLAKCATGESGIRYRTGNDFCSRGQRREK